MDFSRRLRQVWNRLSSPPELAKCHCSLCRGQLRPTKGMIREDGQWFCSQRAVEEEWLDRAHGF